MNLDIFTSVRCDLYSKSENYAVDINKITTAPYLWINGFHDLIMNDHATLEKQSSTPILFFKSAHYPHIEEHERFCDVVNQFLTNSPIK